MCHTVAVQQLDLLVERHLLKHQLRALVGREVLVHPGKVLLLIILSEDDGGEKYRQRDKKCQAVTKPVIHWGSGRPLINFSYITRYQYYWLQCDRLAVSRNADQRLR